MLSPTDLLSLVADQLPEKDKATMVAMLASQKMIAGLAVPGASTSEILDCPFTDEPFTVRVLSHGMAFLLHQHTPGKADCVAGFKKGEEAAVVTALIDTASRDKLQPFARLVFDAFVDLLDRTDEAQADQQ